MEEEVTWDSLAQQQQQEAAAAQSAEAAGRSSLGEPGGAVNTASLLQRAKVGMEGWGVAPLLLVSVYCLHMEVLQSAGLLYEECLPGQW